MAQFLHKKNPPGTNHGRIVRAVAGAQRGVRGNDKTAT